MSRMGGSRPATCLLGTRAQLGTPACHRSPHPGPSPDHRQGHPRVRALPQERSQLVQQMSPALQEGGIKSWSETTPDIGASWGSGGRPALMRHTRLREAPVAVFPAALLPGGQWGAHCRDPVTPICLWPRAGLVPAPLPLRTVRRASQVLQKRPARPGLGFSAPPAFRAGGFMECVLILVLSRKPVPPRDLEQLVCQALWWAGPALPCLRVRGHGTHSFQEESQVPTALTSQMMSRSCRSSSCCQLPVSCLIVPGGRAGMGAGGLTPADCPWPVGPDKGWARGSSQRCPRGLEAVVKPVPAALSWSCPGPVWHLWWSRAPGAREHGVWGPEQVLRKYSRRLSSNSHPVFSTL